MKLRIAALVTMAFAGHAAAQHMQHQQPYTGLEARAVKALSEQQIADLKAGRGMGLAMPAESSEERRVGKECHVVCRSRWSPYH